MWTLHSESYYGECVRHLNVRIGKHISPLKLTCSWHDKLIILVRFLLELYLFWIVVTLFLLNGLFMFLSCVSAWTPLFPLMVLFNLLSFLSWNWTLPLSRVVILMSCVYCNTLSLNLIFSSLKFENRLKEDVRNVVGIKLDLSN